ncbi:MAG: hypothetical protein GY696_38950 [Gammaproteobacteria bacterium]|nr:hypothetical protein [Gammaproteobacteria bacterium]
MGPTRRPVHDKAAPIGHAHQLTQEDSCWGQEKPCFAKGEEETLAEAGGTMGCQG